MRCPRSFLAGLGVATFLTTCGAQARQNDGPYAEPAPAASTGDPYGDAPYGPSGHGQSGYGQAAYGPAPDEERGFEMPAFSVRVDPINWLLEGRLGFELEVAAWEFVSVEVVPVFVANREPPMLNLRSREHILQQESNGWGALAGASVGAGFWLNGKPFRGYVLRAILTNYAYTYETSDSLGPVDRVSHTQRRFVGMLGSQSRFGAFSIGWGFGLGVELNRKSRCFPTGSLTLGDVVENDSVCRGDMEIAVDRNVNNVVSLNGWTHPIYLMGRISLGVTFD
jgi:hypothetical protein